METRGGRDAAAELEEATTSMQQAAAGKHITLQALLPPSPLMVDVDVARIQQVICNLLQNAIKYTHIGGSIWVKAIRDKEETGCSCLFTCHRNAHKRSHGLAAIQHALTSIKQLEGLLPA